MPTLDEVCPADIGEALVVVSLADPDVPLRAHQPIEVTFDFSRVGESGIMLPLRLTVTSGWSKASFRKVDFVRAAPASYTFTPREGGVHVVRIGEVYHRRAFGFLRLEIVGPRIEEGTI